MFRVIFILAAIAIGSVAHAKASDYDGTWHFITSNAVDCPLKDGEGAISIKGGKAWLIEGGKNAREGRVSAKGKLNLYGAADSGSGSRMHFYATLKGERGKGRIRSLNGSCRRVLTLQRISR